MLHSMYNCRGNFDFFLPRVKEKTAKGYFEISFLHKHIVSHLSAP